MRLLEDLALTQQNEETLPQQESEETHETGSQGGHRGAKDLEA